MSRYNPRHTYRQEAILRYVTRIEERYMKDGGGWAAVLYDRGTYPPIVESCPHIHREPGTARRCLESINAAIYNGSLA